MQTLNRKKIVNRFLLLLVIFLCMTKTVQASTTLSNPQTVEEASTQSFKVSFHTRGGTSISSKQVKTNSKLSKPKNPIRLNYKFEGWYHGNKKFNFKQKVTSNIILTARWSKVKVNRTSIKRLKNISKAKVTVSYKKVSKAKGYQIDIATSRNFRSHRITYNTTRTSRTIRNLIKGKTYYVRVRAYKIDSANRKIYGRYSSKKKIKIAKGLKLVTASATSAKITSCKLRSKKTVTVKAKANGIIRSVGDYYYLFALPSYKSSLSKSAKPLDSTRKGSSFSFSFPLNKDTSKSVLQKKFVIAVKSSSKSYRIVSSGKYITNPEKSAKYTYAFTKTRSKKGLQVNINYMKDAADLGIKHTAVNLPINTVIAASYEQNDTFGIPYQYNGKTYWFSKLVLHNYDSAFKAFQDKNVVVSAILLLDWNSDLSYLIDPSARQMGHNYYGLNTRSKKSRAHLEATFSFLAERYSGANGYGKVVNWILGNEVNNYNVWNYAGSTSLTKNAQRYADSFRLVSSAIRSVNKNARIYISLDHLWNTRVPGSFTSKSFLDAFARALKQQGNIKFNIAYHPYPSPLIAPEFWKNICNDLTKSSYSPVINMGNINVLTNYVRRNFGSSTRIILSEQGFTSVKSGIHVEKTQAAAIAYAYYLTEFNPMIDSFILHRHIDHKVEMDQGLYLGLWKNKPNTMEDPGQKKYAWKVFKYMDTRYSNKYSKFALNIIGARSWYSIIPNFRPSRFRYMY
ncbi:DUF5722 domain-containing protein [Anaerosacchariphilus polymeriproducens]|uniref:DUF5722 domain-containing protein n=1 Tax=Anaerosacchariphilus polymeriproducens TaxID=1812858 RepID=A0A371AXS2_9FIRM|nr:DUF5722 domain-containing protein [Anaerosacchariphilus polymeriproducens]RDU24357.1 hypothetical protein DWV06_05120 [Anaerosacchariphilus polymeriproducens]